MNDEFKNHATGLSAPARDAEPIIPDDAIDLSVATRALYIGEAGSVQLRMVSGQDVTLANVQAGVIYPLRIARVMATGTTASGLVALR
ncbi:hypothetical protein RA29_20700 [Tateyamaria sp. ANG-S1]|nr:hypothetical protein RA29_20700 [Tateyamaria sp. ANG-S1]